MRCLVTGATGLLGAHLCRLLIEGGHDVAALVRPSSSLWRLAGLTDRIRIIAGDLSDVAGARDEIAAFAPEVAFHLAWSGVANRFRDDIGQIEGNLTGSLRLIEACAAGGCRTWIGVGSQAEYGRVAGLLHEGLPAQPETLYGAAKLAAGTLGARLCQARGMRFVWLRLVAIYGPMDDAERLFPHVILALLRREVPSTTAGEQRWDYLYVEDAARALYAAAVTPEARGIYNLASGQAVPVRRLVLAIRDLIDPALSVGLGDRPYAPDQIMHLQADIRKLKRATRWLPETSLEDGLRRTVDWFARNRHLY